MKTVWDKYQKTDLDKCMAFSENYKKFLDNSKTEREAVVEAIRLAKKAGFKEFTGKTVKAGDKLYFNNRGKSLALFVVGKESLEKGMNILGAHIDSPRVDLKQNPIYEDNGLVLFDTHYYGGIKKYQWVAIPLALHGTVCKKDGSSVIVSIGEKDNEPVLGISDLLIHLSRDQLSKTGAKVVEGEDLNALAGSIPAKGKKDGKDLVKKNILNILKCLFSYVASIYSSTSHRLISDKSCIAI